MYRALEPPKHTAPGTHGPPGRVCDTEFDHPLMPAPELSWHLPSSDRDHLQDQDLLIDTGGHDPHNDLGDTLRHDRDVDAADARTTSWLSSWSPPLPREVLLARLDGLLHQPQEPEED
ncbi:MAG: hypothetical protein GIKADHBN_02341 [Phycisphaerales bacterium]|nr:hypothetical protein [Phycisphaerales bacterium]